MWLNSQETVDLVTFPEEILNGNFIFYTVKLVGFKRFWGSKSITHCHIKLLEHFLIFNAVTFFFKLVERGSMSSLSR